MIPERPASIRSRGRLSTVRLRVRLRTDGEAWCIQVLIHTLSTGESGVNQGGVGRDAVLEISSGVLTSSMSL